MKQLEQYERETNEVIEKEARLEAQLKKLEMEEQPKDDTADKKKTKLQKLLERKSIFYKRWKSVISYLITLQTLLYKIHY